MASFHVKRLIKATESQIQEIAAFTSEAFYGEISAKAFVGGDWSLLPEFYSAVVRATLLEGFLCVVTIGKGGDEKIVSMGCWFGKGVSLFGTEAQRALGYNAFFEKLSEETKNWLTITYPEIAMKIIEDHFTKEGFAKLWWCSMLATHPKYEGKGYATAIVNEIFEKANAEGTCLGLATGNEINVKKYVSMGFKYRGGGPLPAPTGDMFVHLCSKGCVV